MSVDLYLQLGLDGYSPAKFKEEVDILLVDINDRPIKTHGMVTVPFTFQDNEYEHEFIVTVGTNDHLLIGWDAITKFGFYLGGKEGGIYTREELKNELCQQNNHCTPYMVTAKKTVLKPHSQIICISDLAGGKLPSNIDCFFSPSDGLPLGIHIHAFVSGTNDLSKYNIVVSNDSPNAIKLPKGFPLCAVCHRYKTQFATQNTIQVTEGPVPSKHPNTHTHYPSY